MVFFSVTIGSIGQILLKLGMNNIGKVEIIKPVDLVGILFRIFSNPFIVIALFLYVISLVFWLFVLSRLPLGVAYPLLAMSYIINPLLGYIIFHDSISMHNIAGIILICVGVIIIAKGIN